MPKSFTPVSCIVCPADASLLSAARAVGVQEADLRVEPVRLQGRPALMAAQPRDVVHARRAPGDPGATRYRSITSTPSGSRSRSTVTR
ncbi:hypothetical protein SAMN04487844_12525 [Methylobacterium sp. yr596]|jgi:hypothetical protein|nr:hypothetical protein SAMN04487844_12525 [Methylobacterium sp. yr596]